MTQSNSNIFGWVLVVLVGISVTFSTLHSHHELELNHVQSHPDSEHCLVENTNVCPVCGYLFNADVVDRQLPAPDTRPSGYVAIISKSQKFDSFSGDITGRSPPLFG